MHQQNNLYRLRFNLYYYKKVTNYLRRNYKWDCFYSPKTFEVIVSDKIYNNLKNVLTFKTIVQEEYTIC